MAALGRKVMAAGKEKSRRVMMLKIREIDFSNLLFINSGWKWQDMLILTFPILCYIITSSW